MAIRKVGIVASIPSEIEQFKKVIKDGKWDEKDVVMEVGGVGKASAAMVTQKIVCDHDPDLLLYVGGVGALSPDLMLGDLVVVSQAVDAEMDARTFDPNLKLGQFPFTDKRIFHPTNNLVELALNSPLNLTVKEGYTATVSQFLDTEGKRAFIQEKGEDLETDGNIRQPNIIDMESIGFLMAADAAGKPCLIIRSVANTAGGDAPEDYKQFIQNGVDQYLHLVAYVLTQVNKHIDG